MMLDVRDERGQGSHTCVVYGRSEPPPHASTPKLCLLASLLGFYFFIPPSLLPHTTPVGAHKYRTPSPRRALGVVRGYRAGEGADACVLREYTRFFRLLFYTPPGAGAKNRHGGGCICMCVFCHNGR